MQKRAFAFLLMVVATLSGSMSQIQPAYACTCGPMTPQEQMQRSDAVFVGKVISIESTQRAIDNGGAYIEQDYLVEVLSTYKGVETQQVHVFLAAGFMTADGSIITSSCDRPGFTEGETYFIYATRDGQSRLEASNGTCSRTGLVSFAADDITQLGPGRTPLQPVGMPVVGEPVNYSLILTVLVSLFLVIGATIRLAK